MWRQTCVAKFKVTGAKLIFIDENTAFLYNYDKSGDNKAFFATIVANVATKGIWLDTADLRHLWLLSSLNSHTSINMGT
jgi:hypothetical protein